MFNCSCCVPAKSFSYKKTLYKHQRKCDAAYEDPRQKSDRERRAAYAAEPKRCQTCSVEFSYEDVVSGCKDKYCSRSCAGKTNGTLYPKRVAVLHDCAECGADVPLNKPYCSTTCAASYRARTMWERINQGLVSDRKTLKKYLTEDRGWRCEICSIVEWTGEPVPLELDHIDGDASNDLPSNLRCICPNCHAKLPTSKGKNRGKGRKSLGLRL